jgi:hypothetical protein
MDGYLERLAWHSDCSLAEIMAATGLARSASYTDLPSGFFVALDDATATTFAGATGLARSALRPMLLEEFDGVCLRLNRPAGMTSLRELAVREWAYFTGSHCCPRCLDEVDVQAKASGLWKTQWRLPWSFVCLDHYTLLADTCPQCQRRFRKGHGRCAPPYGARSLEPSPAS